MSFSNTPGGKTKAVEVSWGDGILPDGKPEVDKYSTLSYGINHYSVPNYSVGQIVDVKIYFYQLKVYKQFQAMF